jgi:cytochrome c-type biogenesis protein CcmF
VTAGLVWWRRDRFEPDHRMESFVSREAAFLGNNLLFVTGMFAVLWGTMFPLISEGFAGRKITVGPEWFNRVNIPIGLMLLALLGIGPVIAWRKASPRNLRRNFLWPVSVALVTAAVLWMVGVRHTYALLTFGLGAFVMTTIVVEFHKGTRARAHIERERYLTAMVHLVARNRRRYGGYVVHAGMVVMFAGFAGAAFNVEEQAALSPGESVKIRSPFGHQYTLTYQAMSSYPAQNMSKLVASVEVARNGEFSGMLTAEKRAYSRREEIVSEVGIKRAWNEDLYLILAGIDNMEAVAQGTNPRPVATFRVLVNPLVPWIWLGGLIMAIGTLVAMWPSVESTRPVPRLRAPVAVREPELVEA